jgi:hypothetical protein
MPGAKQRVFLHAGFSKLCFVCTVSSKIQPTNKTPYTYFGLSVVVKMPQKKKKKKKEGTEGRKEGSFQ